MKRKKVGIILAVLIFCLFSGGKFFEKRSYIYKKGDFDYVYLDSANKKVLDLDHPYKFEQEDIVVILCSIKYIRPYMNLPQVKEKAKKLELMTYDEAKKIAPYLVKAFEEANQKQWVAFSMECQRGNLWIGTSRLIDGYAFVKDGKLNFVFKNIAEVIGPEKRVNTSDPLSYYDSTAELLTSEGQSLGKLPGKNTKSRGNWLVIDLASLAKLKEGVSFPESQAEKGEEQKDPKARLKELKDLYESGLITEEEYNKKRKEILDKL